MLEVEMETSGLTALQSAFTSMRVDRENRVIYDVSIITAGEALGHGLWIDEVMLHQVVRAASGRRNGIPMRWTHPSLCNDTMGKQIARAMNFRYDPESRSVRADVHFYKKTSGQRAEMVDTILDLAEEDPEVLGLSIVFERDIEAEDAFVESHRNENGEFVSPDPGNRDCLRHARMAKLDWVDFVNEPAANPRGLFQVASTNDVLFELFDAFISGKPNAFLAGRFYDVFGISFETALRIFLEYVRDRDLVILKRDQVFKKEVLRAISYDSAHPNGTPKAPEDEPWDGPGEVAKADVSDLKIMCAWVEDGKEDLKTAYKFPHHKAEGRHPVVWRAVANAAARLPQANIPESDVPGVKRHLSRHYRDFDKEPPFEREGADWLGYENELKLYNDPLSDQELCSLLDKYGLHEESKAIRGTVNEKKEDKTQVESTQSIEELKKILEDSIKRFKTIIGKE